MIIKIFVLCVFLVTITYPWYEGYSQYKYKPTKKEFKKTVVISAAFVNADISTFATFEGPYGLFQAKIGLEQNLGLTNSKVFFSGNVFWRITKRSGLYGSYYWIHRAKTYTVKSDIPFLDKYVPKGTEIDVHFNTNVMNIGYILTFVDVEKAFLGGYFSVYLINLKTGISASSIDFNEHVNYLAPVPSFGLISTFEIARWFQLKGNIGLFFLQFEGMTERVTDLALFANFRPTSWLGIDVGYKVFEHI